MKRRLVLLLCLGILIAAPFAVSSLSRHRTKSERRLAREAGIPLTAAEFPLPKVAAADDAAPDYLALAALLKRQPLTKAEKKILFAYGHSHAVPDAKSTAAVRKILRAHRDALVIAHRAAGKPAAAFITAIDSRAFTIDGPLPANALRSGGFLIRADSAVAASEGRWDDAIRAQTLEFRIASHAAATPYIIAFLVGVAVDKDAIGGMSDILTWAGPNERVCKSVIRAIEGSRPHYDITRALKGDFLGLSAALQSSRVETGREKDSQLPPLVRKYLPTTLKSENDPIPKWLYGQWESDYLHYLHPLIAAASLPMPQRQAAVLSVQRRIPTNVSHPLHAMSAEVMPVLCKTPAREIETETCREVTLAAADVLMAVARKGKFPDAVSRIDPWTGRPLKYRRERNGFVVYSVGESGRYDGGLLKDRRREARFGWRAQRVSGDG